MGSVCCVARDATTSEGNDETLRRTIQYSPSWGIRWDNRGRVAGEETPVSVIVESVAQNNILETKPEPFDKPLPEVAMLESEKKSESNPQMAPLIKKDISSQFKAHNISESPGAQKITLEVKETTDTPAALNQTLPTTEPNIPSCSTPPQWSPVIPRSQPPRQVSVAQVCGSESPSNFSESEGKLLPYLPLSIIEPTQGQGLQGGSLDRSLQGLHDNDNATSTYKETWSLDNDLLSSQSQELAKSHRYMSDSHFKELKTCVVCSKYLLEKSSFSSQKIIPNNELSVVAILVCGHVYHADCLEHLTPEISKYDPPCPVCTFGEQQAMNMFEKLLKEEMDMKGKKHRSSVGNSDIIPLTHGSSPKLESNLSLRRSFSRPFLKRHFSFSSRASGSVSETTQHFARKRIFPWSKSTK